MAQEGKYRGKPAGEATKDSPGPSLDTLVSRNVLKQLQRDPPPAVRAGELHAPSAKPGPSSAGADADLLASMAKRLAMLERDTKEKGQMLQRLQVENDALKAKLKVAEEEIQRHAKAQPGCSSPGSSSKAAEGSAEGDGGAALAHMRTENGRLRIQLRYAWKQVAEMKSFLSDYGMVWVGNPEEPQAGDGIKPKPGNANKVSASAEGKLAGGWGADADGMLMPPRPPEGAAAAGGGGGGAAMRRRISSPSPSGLAAAAAAVTATAAGDALAHPTSSSSPAPLPSGLLRAGSSPADSAAASSVPHPLPHREASSTSPTGSSIPSGRAALPPLPRTPTLPSHSGPSLSAALALVSAAPSTSSPMPHVGGLPFEMQKLLAAVDELNQVAGDGIGQLVGDKGRAGLGGPGAVLQTPDAVRLVLYRDGLQVHRSAPKPYTDPSSQSVLRDVLDGYFPYVLKKEFPDGVPIKVVDRTSESLASAVSSSNGGNIRTFHDLEDAAAAPESKEHFLNRLPQTVIKNGKVIEIRSEVGRMVGSKASNGAAKPDVALVSTPADALLTTIQRNHAGPLMPAAAAAAPATASVAAAPAGLLGGPAPLPPTGTAAPEIATLQVKSEDGQQTFILKLQYDDNIGALRKCIDAHRAGAAKTAGKAPMATNYEIRSAFPARSYTDAQETLRQAGLVPNATLFLRALT